MQHDRSPKTLVKRETRGELSSIKRKETEERRDEGGEGEEGS